MAQQYCGGPVMMIDWGEDDSPARLERWLLRRQRIESRTVGNGEGELGRFLTALARDGYDGCVVIEDERPALPLSELQASLRAATDVLRGAMRPAEAVS